MEGIADWIVRIVWFALGVAVGWRIEAGDAFKARGPGDLIIAGILALIGALLALKSAL